MKRFMKLAAMVALAGAVAACGGDDDSEADDPDVQELIDAMVSEGATTEQARCFIDELGFDDAERIYGADDADLSEDDMNSALAAFEACGAMEGGDGGESGTVDEEGLADEGDGEDAAAGDETAAGDLAEMRSCVSGGGLQVGESSAPPELDESIGIVDSFTVASESGGVGVVTLYEDGDLATEAREFQSSTEGDVDGLTIGQIDELVYSYMGDDPGLAVLEGCL